MSMTEEILLLAIVPAFFALYVLARWRETPKPPEDQDPGRGFEVIPRRDR